MPPTQGILPDHEIERRLSSCFPGWVWTKRERSKPCFVWDHGFDIVKTSEGSEPEQHRWVCKECITQGNTAVQAVYPEARTILMTDHLREKHDQRCSDKQKKGNREIKAKAGPAAQCPRNLTGQQNPRQVPDQGPTKSGQQEAANATTKRSDIVANTVSAPSSPERRSSVAVVVSTTAFKQETSDDSLVLVDHVNYEGIDWNHLPGFSMLQRQRPRPRVDWVWEHGFEIEKDDSGRQFWLCKVCHGKKAIIAHMYDTAFISQANGHMEKIHHINEDGPMPPPKKRQRTLHVALNQEPHKPGDQGIASFDSAHFRHLLIRWMACDSVPFRMLDSPYFRDLMRYANRAILDSGSLPTSSTVREYVIRSFNRHKGVVKELLSRSLSRINVSFNKWSPCGSSSLLGISVHFLDDKGEPRTFLLGLPQVKSHHSNETLTNRVKRIIREYEIEDCIGFLVADNCSDMGISFESIKSGFDEEEYSVHCSAKIIDYIADSILFKHYLARNHQAGEDPDDFESIGDKIKETDGPIGRLHKIVHWVHRSDKRIEKLHKLQSVENVAVGLEDETTYDVVLNNRTHWHSFEAMMQRGYKLRDALDSLVAAEVREWNEYRTRPRPRRRRCFVIPTNTKTRPAVMDDKMSAEDWLVIADCLAILKPFKIAIERLVGQPQEGKFGAIWEVLPTMKWLSDHMNEAKLRYERGEQESYAYFDCDHGLWILSEYFGVTEDKVVMENAVYVAALVLHPAFRWRTIELQWADEPDWLAKSKEAVQLLWEEYRELPLEQNTTPEQSTIPRATTEATELDKFIASIRNSGATQPEPSPPPPPRCTERDEYAKWIATAGAGDHLVDNPVQYWLQRRHQYPQLSRMAIDIFSLPAVFTADPERVSSLTEQMVSAEGARLDTDFIEAFHCTSSWARSRVIR